MLTLSNKCRVVSPPLPPRSSGSTTSTPLTVIVHMLLIYNNSNT